VFQILLKLGKIPSSTQIKKTLFSSSHLLVCIVIKVTKSLFFSSLSVSVKREISSKKFDKASLGSNQLYSEVKFSSSLMFCNFESFSS
jgi:hypothetical protein